MKRKCFFPAVLFLLFPLKLFSAENNISFNFSALSQNTSAVFTVQSDFLFFEESPFRIGPTFEAGWSTGDFTDYGSDVLVYGWVLCGGLKMQYRIFKDIFAHTDLKASIIYSAFPQILWTECSAGLTEYFKSGYFLRESLGILFLSGNYTFRGGFSCGLRL